MNRACSLILAAAAAFAVCGCWPFHRSPSPQQQFLEAINHGEVAQANQIWLHMNAQDRANLAHNEGIVPEMQPNEIKKQLEDHYTKEMEGQSDVSDQQVESVTPGTGGGTLQDLRSYVPTPAPAPADSQ
jgi:hypothetical protein